MAEAQANARMALMLAIGELQKHTGQDTRITASSTVVDEASPPLLGVWKSWEGMNHDSDGRPVKPDYAIKQQPSSSGDGRFLTWLVSGAQAGEAPTDPSSLAYSLPQENDDSVKLLSEGSLGKDSTQQVHLTPIELDDGSGRLAWWVSGENQKARLMQPYKPRSNDDAGWADHARSHAIPDVAGLGLDSLLDDPESFSPDASDAKPLNKLMSRNTIALIDSDDSETTQHYFHDYSSSAVGLLTNVATGGWRKDMSILTEKWDDIYTSYSGGRLPLFRLSTAAGNTTAVPKPSTNNYDPDQSGLYPWSGYSQIGATKRPFTYHSACGSWQSLVNFATYYRTITYDAGTKIGRAPFGWGTLFQRHNGAGVSNNHYYKYYHGVEINPVVARIQMVVQANAIRDPNPNISNPSLYHRINLRVVPIITLWNPHNVEISKTLSGPYTTSNNAPSRNADFGIGTQRSLPITLGIINGTVPPASGFKYKLFNGGNPGTLDGKHQTGQNEWDYTIPQNVALGYANYTSYGTAQYLGIRAVTAWLPLEFDLKPGEVKVYSPAFNRDGQWSGGCRLKEGYAAGDDFGLAVHDPGSINPQNGYTWKNLHKVKGRSSDQLHVGDLVRFSLKADRYTKVYSDALTTKAGAGTYFSIGTSNWPRSLADINNGGVPKGAGYMRSNMVANPGMDWANKYWPSDDLDEVQYPVSDLVAGGGNPPWTNIFSISFGPRLTIGAGYGNANDRPTKGVLQSSPFVMNNFSIPEKEDHFHPAHGAYDMSYSSMSLNSNLSPEVGTEGYIVSGFQSGEGLSRLVMAEVPMRPMASLVELQSWDMRGKNPMPPYQYNLIGNSDATPLIQQAGILPDDPLSSDLAENLQHDDAYCANHLLFDDWFFSSIAPRPTSFGSSIAKNIETVYRDYLEGNEPLANRNYRPITQDADLSSSQASDRIDEVINSPDGDGWLKVASRFEVDGMFNINSTSIKAWRALLGHARKQQVAYHAANGIDLDSTEHDYVVSRHTIAPDVNAGSATGLGASFPDGSEYTGFRTLTNDQLDDLAVQLVDQIQKRGPFLSLSEFLNRQLNDSDDELALAGALQTALNKLSDNPNKALENRSSETMDAADQRISDAGYSFDEASDGVDTHGLPGWIRQADVLRPIAPVLSARDDTFTIRAYGDAKDSAGKIVARAWCEAVVRRTRDFADSSDSPDSIDAPISPTNQLFGRKYILISFRWLNSKEV
ncbi:MAG: hypothetical protein KJO21_10380 [Verrucomicrobiae bacterium]|nr:hypothetical protein [Verrucomicrobiae bacterium]NNJ43877.1 hypothetical protein [Akkermansiaceae bacterium]